MSDVPLDPFSLLSYCLAQTRLTSSTLCELCCSWKSIKSMGCKSLTQILSPSYTNTCGLHHKNTKTGVYTATRTPLHRYHPLHSIINPTHSLSPQCRLPQQTQAMNRGWLHCKYQLQWKKLIFYENKQTNEKSPHVPFLLIACIKK